MTSLVTGRLLVASPTLADPNFQRTVVLVIQHDDDGSLGVVINRPSDTEVGAPLPGWQRFAAEPPMVFVGGPVGEGAAICLARSWPGEPVAALTPLFSGMGTLDLGGDPDGVASSLRDLRVFAGYAGWGPGQLESELDEGSWFVVDAHPDDPLTAHPEDLWHDVLSRQPGRLAWFANYPADPSWN